MYCREGVYSVLVVVIIGSHHTQYIVESASLVRTETTVLDPCYQIVVDHVN